MNKKTTRTAPNDSIRQVANTTRNTSMPIRLSNTLHSRIAITSQQRTSFPIPGRRWTRRLHSALTRNTVCLYHLKGLFGVC